MSQYRHKRLVTSLLVATPMLLPAASFAQQRRPLPSKLAAPASEAALGNVPDSQLLGFGLTLPLRNSAELQVLLREQQDPKSPQYHRYLSKEEFADRFAPTQADYDRVVSFAKASGFTVVRTFPDRLLVNLRATPSQINKTFAVTMQFHQRATETRKYYAPDVEPSIESSLPILNVVGLSTREIPQSMLVHANKIQGNTTGSGQQGQFLGSDMRAAYAPGVSVDGAGQTVGLIELGPYNVSDVQAYFKAVNQPLNVPIYNVLLDVDGVCSGSPSTGGCDDGEEVIDMEQAISMAPGLSGLLIYAAY